MYNLYKKDYSSLNYFKISTIIDCLTKKVVQSKLIY